MGDPGNSPNGSPPARTPEGLNVAWIHGSPSPRHPTDPPLQVHAYDSSTFILRESKDISFEAPFLYLFFGNDRALLVDTGATADPVRFPLRSTVDRLIQDWLVAHPREGYELVVAHSHSHADHTAGDSQFSDRACTRIVGTTPDAVREFFGLTGGPDAIGGLDLGGRALEVIGIPGHQPASIAIYDPSTKFLLTGDTVYPGRLYVVDMPAFLASLDRLVRFCERRPISCLLGGHVEMSRTAGRDYPLGARYQPQESPLPLSADRLVAIRSAATAVAERTGAYAYEDFRIFHLPCTGAFLWQSIRGKFWNLRYHLGLLQPYA
jgi:hydroxyacylglutathione hydrolase